MESLGHSSFPPAALGRQDDEEEPQCSMDSALDFYSKGRRFEYDLGWPNFCELLQFSKSDTCGQNEHHVDCVNPFNTCLRKGVPCAPLCFPGCDCLPDYFRNKSGVCVRKELC
ncbi:hypothetical protein TNCV_827441 [Trichonephila clavipes]|nr:hypothetical protein TNCV_827441 [Trichonephila clavipes]